MNPFKGDMYQPPPILAGPVLSSAAFKMTSIAMTHRIGYNGTAHGDSNFQVDPVCGVAIRGKSHPETAEIV